MNSDASKPDAPSPVPIGCIRWLAQCLRKVHALRIAAYMLFLSGLLLMAVLGYLHVVGFPEFIESALLRKFRAQGYEVRVERIRVNLVDGVVADQVRLYAEASDRLPSVEARQLVFVFDLMNGLRKGAGLKALRVKEAMIRLNASGSIEEERTLEQLNMHEIAATLWLERGGIRVEGFRARMLGILFQGHGFIVHDEDTAVGSGGARRTNTFARIKSVLADSESWLSGLIAHLNGMTFARPPRADIDFLIHPARTDFSELTLLAKGEGTRIKGVDFDAWNIEAHIGQGMAHIPTLVFQRAGHAIKASGAFDLKSHVVQSKIMTSLPPVCWTGLMPRAWRELLAQHGFFLGGHIDAEFHIGPVPVSNVMKKCTGWISLREAELRDVWFEKAYMSFDWEDPWLRLTAIDARVGRASQQGPLKGKVILNTDDRSYSGALTAGFDPDAVLPVLNKPLARLVRSFEFQESLPRLDFRFSGTAGKPHLFRLTGPIAATNFVYNGAYVSAFHSDLHVEHRIMTLTNLSVVRAEGETEAWVQYDFDHRQFTFAGDSTLNVKPLSKIVGSVIEKIVRSFQTEGPAVIRAEGLVDLNDRTRTRMAVRVDADRVRRWGLRADRCGFDCVVEGPRVKIRELRGTMYDGSFAGELDFDLTEGPTNSDYRITVSWDELDFGGLVTEVRGVDKDQYEGRCSGGITLSGLLGRGRGGTVQGAGTVHISGGRLFRIPLLGGLSKWLSRVYPGWGFSSQTDLKGDFTIRDRKMSTQNLRIDGPLIGIDIVGDYRFNEWLDFKVKAETAGESRLADWVRRLTFPVSHLLKFRLSGTLTDPEWTPENWPAKLLRGFEQEEE